MDRGNSVVVAGVLDIFWNDDDKLCARVVTTLLKGVVVPVTGGRLPGVDTFPEDIPTKQIKRHGALKRNSREGATGGGRETRSVTSAVTFWSSCPTAAQ